MSKYTPMKS